jgi:CHAT domain-containing protein/tetratricopeptide (TPR) repeat protein
MLVAMIMLGRALPAQEAGSSRANSVQREITSDRERELLERVKVINGRAHDFFKQGQFDHGRALLEESLALLEWLHPPERFPAGHPQVATAVQHLGNHLQREGRVFQALTYYRRALSMRERLCQNAKFPNGRRELAESLGGLGDVLRDLGESDMAVTNYRRALGLLERLMALDESPNDLVLAAALLNNLSLVYGRLGDLDQAVEVSRRALELWTKRHPPETDPEGQSDVAHAMRNLGSHLDTRGDHAEALSFLRRALSICERRFPKERSPEGQRELAAALQDVGVCLLNQGKSHQGLDYTQRALTMRETLYPPARYPDGHPELATSLSVLGLTLAAQGDRQQALERIRLALAMRERLHPLTRYPEGHPDLLRSFEALRQLSATRGDYAFILSFQRKKLETAERLFPRDRYPDGHPLLVACLDELAGTLSFLDDRIGATTLYRRSVQMRERLYSPDRHPRGHPELADGLLYLGQSLEFQNEFSQALEVYVRLIGMLEGLYLTAEYPQGHPRLVTALGRAGEAQKYLNQTDTAMVYHRRSLEMAERVFPKERFPLGHEKIVDELERIAGLLRRKGSLDEAVQLLNRAREMNDRLHPPGRPPRDLRRSAIILGDLGAVNLEKGESDKALSYVQRAIDLNEQLYPRALFPTGNEDLAASLHSLGAVLEARGDFAGAMGAYARALKMRQDLASEFIASASEAEALNFTAGVANVRDCMISLDLRHPRKDPALIDAVLAGKACVTRGVQRQHQALFLGTDPKARQLSHDLAAVRVRLSQLPFSGAMKGENLEQELKELTQRKEELERRLAAELRMPISQPALPTTTCADLARALPPGSAYVDFVRYIRHRHIAGERRVGQPAYCAFVAQPRSAKPILIDLGAAEPIDKSIVAWRRAIASQGSSDQAPDTLRKLIWEPIEAHIAAGTTTVWIAPDGALALVPWAAITGKLPGSVLLEDYALALIPSGPFLLDRLLARRPAIADRGRLLVVADVDYDHPATQATTSGFFALSPTSRASKGSAWPPLPGTRAELATICSLAGSRPVTRLSGVEAGLARVLGELIQARSAHLATHGFFVTPREHSILQIDQSSFLHGVDRANPGSRNPQILAGLVLAGANRRRASDGVAAPGEPGAILTAETIAGLPLHDLGLVVLSACETGLGEIAVGEGVFSLQRVFHVSGADNVVASLWKVDDQATAALMALFYDRLWREGKPPLQALREAQLALYHHPELVGKLAAARGTPDFDKLVQRPVPAPGSDAPSSPRHAPARQWAAFVLSGRGE